MLQLFNWTFRSVVSDFSPSEEKVVRCQLQTYNLTHFDDLLWFKLVKLNVIFRQRAVLLQASPSIAHPSPVFSDIP